MGYVPPRNRQPGESMEAYIAYLERLLDQRLLINGIVLGGGLLLVLILVILWSI